MRRPISNFLLLFLIQLVLVSPAISESRYEQIEIYQAETGKPFEEVVADAEFAISEQNFILTNRSEIGKAISRQQGKKFLEVTALQFCNLELAQQILSVSPGFSLHMPCKVVIYEQAGNVIIEAILPTIKQANPELEKLINSFKKRLRDIIDFAAQTH